MYRAPITVDSRQIVLNKKGLSPPPSAVSAGSMAALSPRTSRKRAPAVFMQYPTEMLSIETFAKTDFRGTAEVGQLGKQ